MFRFRGKRKDNGEWVVGAFLQAHPTVCYIYDYNETRWVLIHYMTASISIGKLDSNGDEIFASFEVDGVMTKGGDVVRTTLWGEALAVYESGDNCAFKLNTINSSLGYIGGFPSESLTIIGKQGGN